MTRASSCIYVGSVGWADSGTGVDGGGDAGLFFFDFFDFFDFLAD